MTAADGCISYITCMVNTLIWQKVLWHFFPVFPLAVFTTYPPFTPQNISFGWEPSLIPRPPPQLLLLAVQIARSCGRWRTGNEASGRDYTRPCLGGCQLAVIIFYQLCVYQNDLPCVIRSPMIMLHNKKRVDSKHGYLSPGWKSTICPGHCQILSLRCRENSFLHSWEVISGSGLYRKEATNKAHLGRWPSRLVSFQLAV